MKSQNDIILYDRDFTPSKDFIQVYITSSGSNYPEPIEFYVDNIKITDGTTEDVIDGGIGNKVAFKYRIHDASIGRFFTPDPLAAKFPYNSPYAFAENRVIDAVDLEGLEEIHITEVMDHITKKVTPTITDVNWNTRRSVYLIHRIIGYTDGKGNIKGHPTGGSKRTEPIGFIKMEPKPTKTIQKEIPKPQPIRAEEMTPPINRTSGLADKETKVLEKKERQFSGAAGVAENAYEDWEAAGQSPDNAILNFIDKTIGDGEVLELNIDITARDESSSFVSDKVNLIKEKYPKSKIEIKSGLTSALKHPSDNTSNPKRTGDFRMNISGKVKE